MRNQTLEFMQANFGKAGAYCYWISRGVDNREVRANRIRKSVGAENTFSSDLTEPRRRFDPGPPWDSLALASDGLTHCTFGYTSDAFCIADCSGGRDELRPNRGAL